MEPGAEFILKRFLTRKFEHPALDEIQELVRRMGLTDEAVTFANWIFKWVEEYGHRQALSPHELELVKDKESFQQFQKDKVAMEMGKAMVPDCASITEESDKLFGLHHTRYRMFVLKNKPRG